MIDFDKMAKAHERLFPKADLASQIYKLEEEIKECEEADKQVDTEQALKELADAGIVCIGIYRFTPEVAKAMYRLFDDMYFRRYIDYYGSINQSQFENEITDKWAINESRTWEWNGKTYHHVENKK